MFKTLENRLGRFAIDASTLQEVRHSTNDVLVTSFMKIMSNFLIVKAEMQFASDTVEYIAYSMLFDKISDNKVAPYYRVWIEANYHDGRIVGLELIEVTKQ